MPNAFKMANQLRFDRVHPSAAMLKAILQFVRTYNQIFQTYLIAFRPHFSFSSSVSSGIKLKCEICDAAHPN